MANHVLDINDYMRPCALETLLADIDMPREAGEAVLRCARERGYADVNAHFNALFSRETGGAAVEAIRQLRDTPDSFAALAVYMAAALRTKELYDQKGISDEIFVDSIKAFPRFVREHMASYGFYGFDRDFWMYRCLSLSLFRLGVLEFEMCGCGREAGIPGRAAYNDPVLSVHIPSDAVMTREALDASYAMAKVFFAQYYPEFEYRCAYCNTWLLAPALKTLLPAASRILLFQSDYHIVSVNEQAQGWMQWIYKRKYVDLTQLPENTTLERSAKQHVLAGGAIGEALGVCERL